ncbi:hypothetical protein HNP38_003390 [Chryseobacterium defluvii]|uniref:Secreted protein (Por secretion system target) n=1 Tax=Chryseobacterium defluvii TaxID=160396 RepID=A0A840KKM2_9FLAO|nr:FG-GAP-like repeat-containing protein [Chryseobacterium defluvii]MBB4808050.1 hypothetical protein [Chryseobacterium defluvii]
MKRKLSFILIFSSIAWGSAQQTCSTALTVAAGTHTVTGFTGGTAPTNLCGLTVGGVATSGAWYKYTPTQTRTVTVSSVATGQTVDTRLIVYGGTCGSLACIDASDDYAGNNGSQVTFTAIAGTTYYIAFDNRWDSTGFNFKITETAAPDRLSFTSVPVSAAGSYNNCVVDMNGDYLDDIVSVVSTTQIVISYQQAAGGFTNTTHTVPTTTVLPNWSIAAGDYDNNGFNDLLYGASSGICFVKADASGTSYTSDRKPQSYLVQRTNFVDLNSDGKLDAFVCDDNAPNRYYMNDGTNMNHNQGGIGDYPSGGNYASVWTDYDNDGDVDMFMAKCGGSAARSTDELHRNNGNGTFTNVAATANVADPSQIWSAACGDFNNDGWVDLLMGSNSGSEYSKVMKNNGNGTFSDVTVGSGYANLAGANREYITYDFDNDGYLDILGAGRNIMFGNGNFQFTPNPNSYNTIDDIDRPIGDLNNDGFLDIQNRNNILINNGNTNKWLKVTLRGVQSNRNGIGARVEIYGSWGKQIREVQSGTGFGNMNTLNVHFGIGQATAITKVVVRWPSGIVDTINNVTPKTTLHVIEGASALDVNEIQNTKELFTVYPNPSDNMIYFNTKGNFVPVEAKVYDASGKMVLQTKVEKNSISIREFNPGIYMLHLTDKSGVSYTQKVIKK